MVEQLGRRFPLDAHHAAVGVIMIRLEPGYAPILDGRDGGAVRRAERAITVNVPYGTDIFCKMGHRLDSKTFLHGVKLGDETEMTKAEIIAQLSSYFRLPLSSFISLVRRLVKKFGYEAGEESASAGVLMVYVE
jgi:hypothetical protein